MSYDIELVNKVTGETAKMKHPQYVRGGTVPARVNPVTKELEQAEQVEAHINITYNYSHYYYEATDGDIRFAHDEVSAYYADGTQGPFETKYGIRGLIDTERTKTVYYKNGKEIKERNVLDAILNHDYDRKEEVTYSVNEGDISSYYMATAANAIMALKQMMVMATDNLTEKNIVWDGD